MQGSVVIRMGPCGGAGGHPRDMDMRGVRRVVKVVVRHGDAMDAMSVLYERNGREEWTDLWGGRGDALSEPPASVPSALLGHWRQRCSPCPWTHVAACCSLIAHRRSPAAEALKPKLSPPPHPRRSKPHRRSPATG
ncbi:hypothetical protein ABZP36_025079 [Zizania latifolia]